MWLRRSTRTTSRKVDGDSHCAASSSAIVPVTLPTDRRCAPMAGHPTPLLTSPEALWFQSVAKAEYRYRQAAQCIGSLAHRHQRPACAAWTPISGSAAMLGCQSLRLVATAHHRFTLSILCSLSQWARRGTALPRLHQAVAWCAWQLWFSPATAKLHNAALPSVPASQSQAPFVAATASRPSGEGNRRYAKLPSLGTVAQPSALPGRIRALRADVWLPCGCCGTVA